MLLRRSGLALLAVSLLAVPALAACSGGGGGEPAADLLTRAKKTPDETQSPAFALYRKNAPTSGAALVGGEGDIARPASFQGTLKVLALGSTPDLRVISVDRTVYAQLPFTTGFSVVDPAQFGFGDPGALLDPQTGI